MGIVNLTRVWQTGPHEQPNTQLPTTPFSFWNYQPRRVALPSILPQLPWGRRITGQTWHLCDLWDHSQWCQKFGPDYARKLKKRQGRLGDTWHIDEVFVTIQGQRQYLWRAVDQDGDCIDILVQRRRNQRAAERFFRRLLKGQGREPRWLVTDKLRSYDARMVKKLNTRWWNTGKCGVVA